jgi:hypothetical protein
MKKILLLVILVAISFSCNKDDNNSNTNSIIVGQWKLSHILSDPGDGTGTFQPVESGKTLIFRPDNIVTCNGSLCYMTVESDIATESTYSISNKTITSDCSDTPDVITYEIIDAELILNYPCDEGCKAKYTRIPEEIILH